MKAIISISFIITILFSCSNKQSPIIESIKEYENKKEQVLSWSRIEFTKPEIKKLSFDETYYANALRDSSRKYSGSDTGKYFDSIIDQEKALFKEQSYFFVDTKLQNVFLRGYLLDSATLKVCHLKLLKYWEPAE